MKYGYRYGLIAEQQWHKLQEKERSITEILTYLDKKNGGAGHPYKNIEPSGHYL